MKINKLYLLLIATVFISCQKKEETRKLPYYNTSDFTPVWELPTDGSFHAIRDFNLIDQEGKPFTAENIKGKICVVDFFFTSCPGICPKMAKSMNDLQRDFIKDDKVLLVSHSVTPEQDSVSVLAKYAQKNDVNYNKWKLLTGEKEEVLITTVEETLVVVMVETAVVEITVVVETEEDINILFYNYKKRGQCKLSPFSI